MTTARSTRRSGHTGDTALHYAALAVVVHISGHTDRLVRPTQQVQISGHTDRLVRRKPCCYHAYSSWFCRRYAGGEDFGRAGGDGVGWGWGRVPLRLSIYSTPRRKASECPAPKRPKASFVHSLPKRVRPKGPTAFHFSCTAIKGSQTQSRRLVYSCAVTERRMYLQL